MREVAAEVGLSPSALSAVERGEYWVQMPVWLHLCEVLQIQPWELFPPLPGTPARELLSLLPTLSSERQAALITLLFS
jgi:transcriptional regulator with XRE-family HTH domain